MLASGSDGPSPCPFRSGGMMASLCCTSLGTSLSPTSFLTPDCSSVNNLVIEFSSVKSLSVPVSPCQDCYPQPTLETYPDGHGDLSKRRNMIQLRPIRVLCEKKLFVTSAREKEAHTFGVVISGYELYAGCQAPPHGESHSNLGFDSLGPHTDLSPAFQIASPFVLKPV